MNRKPAVAGRFYPAQPSVLAAMLADYLQEAETVSKVPKAIIVPHAGYIYSAAIAASAYARLKSATHIKKVVLIGPSHYLWFKGLAVCSADAYSTPLGDVPVDREMITELLKLPYVSSLDEAHANEHSLEVHLPFLQTLLQDFTLIPIVAGKAEPEEVAGVLDKVWDAYDTLVVISSDLSHYHDYGTARGLDKFTSHLIETLQYRQLTPEMACGKVPITGLLYLLKQKHLAIKTIDLRNSGDTAGDKSRVVGYGAYVVE
jgi:AmmeMemoRadiSam system protein B